MSFQQDIDYAPRAVGHADQASRSDFIVKTYMHLLGAVLAFTAILVFLFQSGLAEKMTMAIAGMNWLIILGAFMVVSWLATRVAAQSVSLPAQYMALAGYVVAEALIFTPLVYIAASHYSDVLMPAVLVTVMGFSALSAIAFITRADFSFLRGIIIWGGLCALGAIVLGVLFGWTLGPLFSVAMIALAGASILYDTSNVLHHYPRDRYVAASLQLFASVAVMLWYVLRLFMSRD